MHDTITWLAVYWRWLRDAVTGLFRPAPEVPAPMPEPLDRAGLFAQLRTLREQRAIEATQAQHDVDNLTARWRAAQTIADETRRELSDIQRADFGANLTHTAEEDRLLRQIVAKSSMSLCVFIEELDHELSVLHHTEEIVLPSAHRDYVIGKKTIGLETDAVSRKRRCAALLSARERARQMQLEALSIESMNAELLRLRKIIPPIEHEILHGDRARALAAI